MNIHLIINANVSILINTKQIGVKNFYKINEFSLDSSGFLLSSCSSIYFLNSVFASVKIKGRLHLFKIFTLKLITDLLLRDF